MSRHATPLRPLHLAVLPGGSDGDLQAAPGRAGALTQPLPRRWHVLLAFGVALAAAILWGGSELRAAGGLAGLPSAQRAALCQRTLANLREVCRGPGHPRDFCRAQATLVAGLPECDAACQAEARAQLLADTAVR